jgi:hypothetical protein
MTRLFIQVDADGTPINHPILEENLAQAFPGFNPDAPPAGFAEFVWQQTGVARYETPDRVIYNKAKDGVVRGLKINRPLTAHERSMVDRFVPEELRNKGTPPNVI